MVKRIGHQRAGAGAAAGADRNALRLRPLDEVGDDQEVAGIFHAGDDAEFEVEPLAVFLLGMTGRDAGAGEPVREASLGALAQFAGLVHHAFADRKARQDRRLGVRAEGAALRDLDRRGQRLRQIGEQRGHLGAALEAMLGGELAAVALRQHAAFGDADQRVVRFVVGAVGEIRLVGGDQRNAFAVGEIDQHRLGHALVRRAMALQFDIEPVAEQAGKRVEPRGGEMALAGGDRRIERAAGPAGERDDALGLAFEPVELEPRRLVRRRIEEGARGQPHQAAIAGLARGQEHDALARLWRVGIARAVVGVAEIDGERAADDRLDAGASELFGEFQRTEHVVGVGERQRRLLVGFRELGKARERYRAFQQRIGRVHVQVHEVEVGQAVIPWLPPECGRRALKSTRPHAGGLIFPRHPEARAQRASKVTELGQRLLNTCDQMAIMPTNSVSDARAAASWIMTLNMVLSSERTENIVHDMFQSQR